MYMLVCAVVLAVLAAEGQAQRSPCCFPERWRAAVHQSVRFYRKDAPTYGYRAAYLEYAYDFPGRRIAARIHNEYPNSYERFLLNFNQDRAYFIREDGCRYRDFRARDFGRACIPESASYQGEFYMGLNQLSYYRWYVFSEHEHSIIDVTSDNCAPGFSKEHFENDEFSTHIDRVYANITTVMDETIFTEPSDCVEDTRLSFFDLSDDGINRMHAFHLVPTLFSKNQKHEEAAPQHKKPLHFKKMP